ncbi:hypothetical protein WR25_15665 [Diploscapter pachys]|uniref:Transmembrane protein n=1 Tax=Diploscapter pachys TaxID=2018661 RepID=A0A2A2JC49_9BILA|nr:hypothetical protein WR25_15665 [Diploscapter pachys]
MKHQFTNMEYVWLFSLTAAVSYFFYCLLFIIGQVWYAFIFLGIGVVYYGILFYGLYKRNQEWMGIAILPQASRRDSDGSMRASEITDPAPTMAIDPAIPTSSFSDPIVIPRLRTVTEGPMAYPDPTSMRMPRIMPTSYRL